MTPQIKLTAARNTGATVTVTLADGRSRTGVVLDSARGRDYFLVSTPEARPRAHRAMFFHADDVLEVKEA